MTDKMTREEAILWMKVLKHAQINWVGEQAEEEDIIARCEEAEQEAIDMAIEALSVAVSREEYEEVKAYMDTLKVVRCKDCRYWTSYGNCTRWTDDTHDQAYTNANDFCSYGERRGEDDVESNRQQEDE